MGSSESTGRLNGTEKKVEENDSSGGSSSGTGKAIAIAAAGTAVAVWGISRMLSSSTDKETQEKEEAMTIKAPRKEAYRLNSGTNIGDRVYVNSQKSTWSPPPPGRFKMNTDGSTHSNQNNVSDDGVQRGPSGYGGILRDDSGKWVQGFRGNIRESDSLTAEIHGIHKGLKLLDKLGLEKSILESDHEKAVEWIKRRDDDPGKSPIIHACWDIIEESRRLIDKNKIEIKHVYRDVANKRADKLARMGRDSPEEYVDIFDLPNEIKYIFDGQYSVI